MSGYGSLYVIGTTYNSARGAYEVSVGYMTKDEEVKGRITTITIVVNVPDHKGEEDKVREIALEKVRKTLELASTAPLAEE